MFQVPKSYTAQMCEVHLQYENSTTKLPFYTFFFGLISLYTYLFSFANFSYSSVVSSSSESRTLKNGEEVEGSKSSFMSRFKPSCMLSYF